MSTRTRYYRPIIRHNTDDRGPDFDTYEIRFERHNEYGFSGMTQVVGELTREDLRSLQNEINISLGEES